MAFSERVDRTQNLQNRNRSLYRGTRKSHKLVRCYWKEPLGVFRVELELHSSFLRNHRIANLEDLESIASLICPDHVHFVAVDWNRLEKHLIKARPGQGRLILEGTRKCAASSVHTACQYLRKRGVNNPHRFLVPLRLNKKIISALYRWERKFMPEVRWTK